MVTTYIKAQAQSQPLTPTEASNKPVVAPSPTGNTASVVVVTEVQPSPSPPTPSQVPLFSGSSSISELVAFVLALTVFVTVLITVSKR